MAQEERIMDKKKDALEQRLAEDFKKLAEKEEQNMADYGAEEDSQMPEERKTAIRAKLDDEIEKIREAEKAELYSRLSEEDLRALELGKKAMREEKERRARRHTRKPQRLYIAVAVLVVALCGVSVDAFGVQERMVTMIQSMVGDREVEKVNSSDENLVIVEEDEEEAYQRISDEFGVEPVRIAIRPDTLLFDKMVFDKRNQMAELWYQMEEESIVYFINASYKKSSWGVDVEDEILRTENREIDGCRIEIKEYQIDGTELTRFSAQFADKGLEYFFIGTMNQNDFDRIINNLYFL